MFKVQCNKVMALTPETTKHNYKLKVFHPFVPI